MLKKFLVDEVSPEDVQNLLAEAASTLDGIITPFQVVKMILDSEQLRDKLYEAFQNVGWHPDTVELFLNDIQDDDPLPVELLCYYVPLLVLLHDTFGCCLHGSPLQQEEAQAIAAAIPCINAAYELRWPEGSKLYSLVFLSDKCIHSLRRK